MNTDLAVILLAHGTKNPESSQPVYGYAKQLSLQTHLQVEPCLREFIEPSIPTVVDKLATKGYRTIFVLPFFLFKSAHVTRDIQNDIEIERKKYPDIKFIIGEPLGDDPLLFALLFKRLEEGLKQYPGPLKHT
ncbi:MAG: CbiX/SirB N-terminal domain-containing protein [Bdellovibrionales bacterium]|nr:CbiX/SirB N-terminal domain-containing protein [Bdellovibrionales bacterium]